MSDANYRESTYSQGQPVAETSIKERRSTISPARIIGGVVGVVLIVVGIVGIVRAGLDSTMTEPVVEVVGLEMSAVVGVALLVVGLLLVLAAATVDGAAFVGVMGVLLVLGGVFAVAATDDLRTDVGIGQDTGWFMIITGAICMLALFLNGRTYRRRAVSYDGQAGGPVRHA